MFGSFGRARIAIVLVGLAAAAGQGCLLTSGLDQLSKDHGDAELAADGGGPDEAGVDGGSAPATNAGTRYCDEHAPNLLCDDFDRPTSLQTGWSVLDRAGAGFIDFDGTLH